MKVIRASLPCSLSMALVGFTIGCGASFSPSTQTIQSQVSFNFGPTVVLQPSSRAVITVTNPGAVPASVAYTLSGSSTMSVLPNLSCGTTLLPGGSCSVNVAYTPQQPGPVQGSLVVTLNSPEYAVTDTVALSGTGVQLSPGEAMVTPTLNPVVALYSYQPTVTGTVAVQFGPTTAYGLTTSAVPTSPTGGPVSIFVAGMQQSSTYHMQAVVKDLNGNITTSPDSTFTTTAFPAAMLPALKAVTTAGLTPQPGIELNDAALSISNPNYLGAYATDLAGNIIWGYNFPDRPTANTIVQPIKLMTNGNLLLTLSFASQFVIPGQGAILTPADQSVDLVREIDLAGDTVQQITLNQINQKLTAAGYSFNVDDIHHDVCILPNGHLVLITNTTQNFDNLPGYPGTTTVLGDVLIDLDTNFNVDWVWNEFDHLDVNRHPYSFPDWTHTNAVVYSPSDGNLFVSMRHQNWVVKVDYNNAQGAGDILWKLGEGGNFTLIGGTDPQDWFYAQHEPSIVTPNSTGNFTMTLMDNGDDRILAGGILCGTTEGPCYTTVPILNINESAMTATVAFRVTVPDNQYSDFGGNATVLANGNLEYDLCADPAAGVGSSVVETTVGNNPQVVWQMTETGASLYRAHRIPSLYPGVTW